MMVKTKVSLTESVDQKVNEYRLINGFNYSQAIRRLVELGVESISNKEKIIDIYKKLDDIDLQSKYLRKLIENIKIDQINAITYTFQDDKISKDVTLKIENGNLICADGVSFNTWLLSNFGI